MAKISVIVPIYNVEDYLKEALSSLKNQTLKDIEIIAVNDGSTDSSAEILAECAKADERIRIIEKENGGLSSARNAGIDAATSPFVCFLDSDDTFEPAACAVMVDKLVSSGADVLCFGANCIPNDGGNSWMREHLSPMNATYGEFNGKILFNGCSRPWVWRNAYSLRFLNDNSLRFDETCKFGEDQIFQCESYPLAKKSVFIKDKLYNYQVARAGSLMNKFENQTTLKGLEHAHMLDKILDFWEVKGLVQDHKLDAMHLVIDIGVCFFEGEDPSVSSPIFKAVGDVFSKHFNWDDVANSTFPEEDKWRLWDLLTLAKKQFPTKDTTLGAHFENGKIYIPFETAKHHNLSSLKAEVACGNRIIPANIYPTEPLLFLEKHQAQRFVIELPDANLGSASIKVTDGIETIVDIPNFKRFAFKAKVQNKLKNTPHAGLVRIEERNAQRTYQIRPIERFDKGEHAIWRCLVIWEGDAPKPEIKASDIEQNPIDATIYDFELQRANEASHLNNYFISIELSASTNNFMLTASGELNTGFCVMDDFICEQFKRENEARMANAQSDVASYKSWFEKHKPQAPDVKENIQIGVLLLEEHDEATMKSLEAQTYKNWALADGEDNKFDRIAIVNGGDVLDKAAFAEYVANSEGADIIFCDEDESFEKPIFKLGFSPDRMYSQNQVGNMLMVKPEFLETDATDVRFATALKAYSKGATFKHIEKVLYHRMTPCVPNAEDLRKHLEERNIAATVEETTHGLKINYQLRGPEPLVSIIIPNKDHLDVLKPCLASIEKLTTWSNYEVVIVENNSVDEATFDFYESVRSENVRIVRFDGEFNYSAIVNFGASQAKGEYFCFLNNDTKVITPDWIQELIGPLERPEVGVTGAKLYFRDGLVQHAGMFVNAFLGNAHPNQNFDSTMGGYLDTALVTGNFISVTGACQMVKRETFDEVGGYSEDFKVGFNDTDFCLKIYEAGKLVVFTPHAELNHFEFTSRGREVAGTKEMERLAHEQDLFRERWGKVFEGGDPYSNTNLDPNDIYYKLKVQD